MMEIWNAKSLDDNLCLAVLERWHNPCEAAFEYIAQNNILQLAEIITNSNLDNCDLTFAVETFGHKTEDGQLARDTLFHLLFSDSALIREGVIYGLEHHIDRKISSAFKYMLQNDPNKSIKLILKEILNDQDNRTDC